MATKKTAVKKKVAKKRKVSPATLKALAKGRKKLAAMRKGTAKKKTRKVVKKTVKKTPAKSRESIVIINQGDNVKKRRVKRKSPAKKVTSRRRKSSYMSGAFKGSTVKKVKSMAVSTLVGTIAGIGGSMAISKVPVANAKIKASLPLIAGMLVALNAKGKNAAMINQAANGLMIVGGLSLVKQFAPQYSLLAGENFTPVMIPENMGLNTDLMGIPVDSMQGLQEDDGLYY